MYRCMHIYNNHVIVLHKGNLFDGVSFAQSHSTDTSVPPPTIT